MNQPPAPETASEGDLHDVLAAIRPPQTDAYAASLRASVRRSLFGTAGEPFRLGRFTVLEPLGGGGMGVVFVAYDPDLDRKIALKVLRNRGERGRKEVLREGRALARLKHPNVVAVYEVGVLDDDVFVAMEYVEGKNLREWLREPRSTAAILARLIEAGRGLAAAHAVDLVHRDFKPENVVIDARGDARVIDFGLARPTADLPETPQLTVSVPTTSASVHGGTPAYMAPERLAGASGDHRSDQYSFAVTCWEALFGARPTDPPAATPPQARSVPGWLHKVLSRGLSVAPADRYPSTDAMLAALRADPTRRRRALAGVALASLAVAGWFGVQNYREAQQVAACTTEGARIDEVWNPATRTTLQGSLLATGVSYATTTAHTADAYLDAQAQALKAARTEACLNVRVRGTWDSDTLDRSLWCLDERRMELEALLGELSRGDASAVNWAVEAAAGLSRVQPCQDPARLASLPPLPHDRERVRQLLRDDARVLALRMAGRYDDGLRESLTTLAAAEALQWPPLTARVRRRSGYLLHLVGKYPEAEAALESAYFEATAAGALDVAADAATGLIQIVGYQQARHQDGIRWSRHVDLALAVLDPGDETSSRRADAQNLLAQVHDAMGDYPQAVALHERSLAIREQLHGPAHPVVAVSLNNLANVHYSTKAFATATPLYQRALAIQEQMLGPEHPDVATSLSNLANVHLSTGAYDDARRILERAIAIDEKALGPDHPDLASSLQSLASAHRLTGDHAAARTLLERALAIREKALGPDHPQVALNLSGLATVLARTGAYEEARAMHVRALAIREKALGPDHKDVAISLINLAGVHKSLGDLAQARALAERALAIGEKTFGPDHLNIVSALDQLALIHVAAGTYDAATQLADRSLAIREAKLGPDHPDLAVSLGNVALVRESTGAYAEAEALYLRTLAIDEHKLGPDNPEVAYTVNALARVALANGHPADALPLAERAVGILAARDVPPTRLAECRIVLAQALATAPAAQGRDPARALALARQARDVLLTAKGKHKALAQAEALLARPLSAAAREP